MLNLLYFEIFCHRFKVQVENKGKCPKMLPKQRNNVSTIILYLDTGGSKPVYLKISQPSLGA